MALMGLDGFQGVRTEGARLVVEVAGHCVPTEVDEVVDRFRAQHGVEVVTEVDEAASEVMVIWLRARAQLRRSVTDENWRSYFEPLEARDEGGVLVLSVSDGFFAQWVSLHYGPLIWQRLVEAEGGHLRVLVESGDGRQPLEGAPTEAQETGRQGPFTADPTPQAGSGPFTASGRRRGGW